MQAVSWFTSGFHTCLSLQFATFILERKLRGDVRNIYKYLKHCKENAAQALFPGDQSQWTQSETQEVPSKYWVALFHCEVTEHWQRLPRRGGEISTLGGSPKPSIHSLRQLAVGGPAWAGDWNRWHPEISSNPNPSVILWKSKAVGLLRFWLLCNF